ncbi:MAG TPA: hypothetical protein VJK51_05445 [Candidatus Nanoarchaeia archaeon]|nr:hypothetical protein [Candidatus Nanoarchaeia archaeon]
MNIAYITTSNTAIDRKEGVITNIQKSENGLELRINTIDCPLLIPTKEETPLREGDYIRVYNWILPNQHHQPLIISAVQVINDSKCTYEQSFDPFIEFREENKNLLPSKWYILDKKEEEETNN